MCSGDRPGRQDSGAPRPGRGAAWLWESPTTLRSHLSPSRPPAPWRPAPPHVPTWDRPCPAQTQQASGRLAPNAWGWLFEALSRHSATPLGSSPQISGAAHYRPLINYPAPEAGEGPAWPSSASSKDPSQPPTSNLPAQCPNGDSQQGQGAKGRGHSLPGLGEGLPMEACTAPAWQQPSDTPSPQLPGNEYWQTMRIRPWGSDHEHPRRLCPSAALLPVPCGACALTAHSSPGEGG